MSIYTLQDPEYRPMNNVSSVYAYYQNLQNTTTTLSNYLYNSIPKSFFISEILPTRITRKGITEDSFTIIDEGVDLPFSTHMVVEPVSDFNSKDDTYVTLFFKINHKTIESLSQLYVNQDIIDTTIYLVLTGDADIVDNDLLYYNSGAGDSIAIISCDVNPDKSLTNPQIIRDGSFGNTGPNNADTQVISFTESLIIPSPVKEVYLTTYATEFLYSPLNGKATILRRNDTISSLYTNSTDEAVLSMNLILNPASFNISGGNNYQVNDTFTVTGGDVDGQITITEVDQDGGILSFYVSNVGNNFTIEPVVSYDNMTGSGANISSNDVFVISDITVDHPGHGYLPSDKVIVLESPSSSKAVEINNEGEIELTLQNVFDPETDIIFNNSWSIDKVVVNAPGYAHQYEPKIKLIDLSTGYHLDNKYITSNNFNFIDIDTV